MEKNEYIWKYDTLLKDCATRFLEILKEKKVERIDLEDEDMYAVTHTSHYFMTCDKVIAVERYDNREAYDQYKIVFEDSQSLYGYISGEYGIENMGSQYIFPIYSAVVDAIEKGEYETIKK